MSPGKTGHATYTVKVDTTKPTVTYTGNLASYGLLAPVAITCTPADSLSGVASSTCANVSGLAWSFGAGPHPLSAAATDNTGNTGNGSTSFTVTVKSADLCTLTGRFVQGSAKYVALKTAIQKAAVTLVVHAACAYLTWIGPTLRPAQESAYSNGVQALVAPGWLTQPQATTLKGLAGAL